MREPKEIWWAPFFETRRQCWAAAQLAVYDMKKIWVWTLGTKGQPDRWVKRYAEFNEKFGPEACIRPVFNNIPYPKHR